MYALKQKFKYIFVVTCLREIDKILRYLNILRLNIMYKIYSINK